MSSHDTDATGAVPFADFYSIAQKVAEQGSTIATTVMRLDAIETWRRQVIDDGLPNLEKRITAVEQIARDMQADLHTIMGSMGTMEGNAGILTAIQHDIKALQLQQAQQNSQWDHYAERQRKISEAQELARRAQDDARRAQEEATRQAQRDAQAIKSQVASLANRALLIGTPILGAFAVNTLALDHRWRLYFSYSIAGAIVAAVLFFAARYGRVLLVERRARRPAPLAPPVSYVAEDGPHDPLPPDAPAPPDGGDA